MRKFVPILGAVAAWMLTTLPALAAQPAPSIITPTRATLSGCHFSTVLDDRYGIFDGAMGATSSTKRMQMRFDLYARHRRGAFRLVRFQPAGFADWRSYTPTRAFPNWRLRQRVTALTGPADFRAVVKFRWFDANGVIIKFARLRTPICRQPDPRPNLGIAAFSAQPGVDATQATYFVTVTNTGRSSAGAFDVLLSVDGAPQPMQTLTSLAAGLEQVLTFTGPRCTADGSGVRVRVDPDDRVSESVESDNSQTFACPI